MAPRPVSITRGACRCPIRQCAPSSDDAVAAVFLGRVETQVGLVQQPFRRHVRPELGDPEADGNAKSEPDPRPFVGLGR
jgi:hypothetical protein